MFLNKKRLLLTLFRLEEGQQDILQRLERLERRGDTSSVTASPCHLPLDTRPQAGVQASNRRCAAALGESQGKALSPSSEGDVTPDTWIIDGIEAILSYRRNPKEETK